MRLYDAMVYGFTLPVLWGCPKSRIIELYDANVSGRHLDIGVATGRLLAECHFPVAAPEITLMDLNRNSLDAAARRLARYEPRVHQANVLEPWDLPAASYDSVGMSNLLHCLPGDMSGKATAFEHARTVLAPGGVLFGATVLGEGVESSRLTRAALASVNRNGTFSNLKDSLDALAAGIDGVFGSHEIRVQGIVALFVARATN